MAGTSIREQIIAAAITALQATGKPAGLNVFRERTRPIEIDSLPSIMVYAEDDPPKPFDGQTYRSPFVVRVLLLRLELRAACAANVAPDTALDPLIVWAIQAIMANEQFGSLANGVEEIRTAWNSREGDTPVAAATIHFTVRYRTSRLDPVSES